MKKIPLKGLEISKESINFALEKFFHLYISSVKLWFAVKRATFFVCGGAKMYRPLAVAIMVEQGGDVCLVVSASFEIEREHHHTACGSVYALCKYHLRLVDEGRAMAL